MPKTGETQSEKNAIFLHRFSVLPKKTNLIEKHKKVVLFCNSGKRSKSAIALLQNNPYNFNNLASLKGGIIQWKNAIKQPSETK